MIKRAKSQRIYHPRLMTGRCPRRQPPRTPAPRQFDGRRFRIKRRCFGRFAEPNSGLDAADVAPWCAVAEACPRITRSLSEGQTSVIHAGHAIRRLSLIGTTLKGGSVKNGDADWSSRACSAPGCNQTASEGVDRMWVVPTTRPGVDGWPRVRSLVGCPESARCGH